MDRYENQQRKVGRARARQMARKRKQHRPTPQQFPEDRGQRVAVPARVYGGGASVWRRRAGMLAGDMWWYLRNNPVIVKTAGGLGVAVFALFIITTMISGKIFPNVSTVGVDVGGLSVAEAEVVLLDAWVNEVQFELVDGERVWSASPIDLGLQLDARETAEAARGARLSSLPFGRSVEPVVTVDFDRAQNYLLNLADEATLPAFNPGFNWADGELVGMPGQKGRVLDVAMTMNALLEKPGEIAGSGRLELQMIEISPDAVDATPYFEQAREFINQSFELNGYDPFKDEHITWTTDRETLTSWLEVNANGLTLREETFAPFVQAQNLALSNINEVRFLEANETMEKMRAAIDNMDEAVSLRIRYRAATYEVQAGDTAFAIGRKTGIPFFLLQEANPGRDLAVLSPGDVIGLPSRDVMVPLDPVANKRIVVDLNNQRLEAYEDGELAFHWLISSGIETAPTSPGVYQILTHEEVAYGGSFALCDDAGCGEWEMENFMGLYEVTPGLMNGFHGAVGLPDGTYLGGNQVGTEFTFGCVMSRKDQAQILFDWAEQGVVVEIISNEFAPESRLAAEAFSNFTDMPA